MSTGGRLRAPKQTTAAASPGAGAGGENGGGGAPARLHLTPSAGFEIAREYAIVLTVLALFIVLSLTSHVFLTRINLLNIFNQTAPVGIIACALTFVLIVGEFDLSAGAIAILTGVLATKWQPSLGTGGAMLAAICVGVGVGIVNGLLVTYARINSFVCTLSTSLVVAGLSTVITKGFVISVSAESFSSLGTGTLLGANYSIWIFGLFAVVCGFVLSCTRLGRHCFAVGGNAEAARLSGVNTKAVKARAFALSGLAAGLAGVLIASRTSQAEAGEGLTTVLSAFAAVVVGGTSVLGGRGAIWRTFLGVLFLALITNGFNLLGVDPTYQQIIQGAVILLAVAGDSLAARSA